MDQLNGLVNLVETYIRAGYTIEQTYKELSQISYLPSEQIQAAIVRYAEKTGRIRDLKEPITLKERGLNNWYPGPSPTDPFWPELMDLLLRRGWSADAIESLDAASSKVLSLLQPPGQGKIS